MNTELKKLLQENIVKVTFTKKDGTLRTMPCTLKEDLIPEEHRPKSGNNNNNRSEAAQAVYVTDAGGWRSFRWDSLKEFVVNED